MMRTTRTLWGAALAMTASMMAGACSDTSGPEALDQSLLEDVAVVAADAVLEDLALMGATFGFGLQAAEGLGEEGLMGIGDSFTRTRTVTFFDEAGEEMTGYDPLNTASIRLQVEMSGEKSREHWNASIERSRDMMISGLLGEETTRQWDGTGTEAVDRSRHLEDGTERTYDMDGTFTYDAVVVPVPGSEPRWPLSGTITRNMTITIVNGPNGDVTRTVEVVIVFDGDETATASVNGEPVEIDLSARDGRWPLKGRMGHKGG